MTQIIKIFLVISSILFSCTERNNNKKEDIFFKKTTAQWIQDSRELPESDSLFYLDEPAPLFRKEFQIVNLEAIEKLGLDTVDAQILADNGLVRSPLKPIKILADGELKLKVTVTASAFSESAKEQIEQAGGAATVQ